MPAHRHAVELASELGLLDTCVFFGDWVPYSEWSNYLLESDVGISLHYDTLETHLAFRTRILDYVWAGLPMVVTRGDATSELVSRLGLGEVMDYERDDEVAAALLRLLEKPRADFGARFERARAELTWEKAAAPLIEFCQRPRHASDRADGDQPSPAAWEAEPFAVQRGLAPGALGTSAAGQAEIARLQALVDGYERGRFIRLMKWLRNFLHRWTGK
jgi:hypothetical protein